MDVCTYTILNLLVLIADLNHVKDLRKILCCRELKKTLESSDLRSLKPLEPGQPGKFASFLDKVMGIS